MPERLNIVGQRFGRLVVKAFVGVNNQGSVWSCLCDCGNRANVVGKYLRSMHTRSCGCLLTDAITTHGLWKSPESKIFRAAKQRCTNPKDKAWKNYGGRGIECRFVDFAHFYKEVGPRPFKAATIDRINNDGHYEPGNVRWSTRKEQNNNKRSPVIQPGERTIWAKKAWVTRRRNLAA